MRGQRGAGGITSALSTSQEGGGGGSGPRLGECSGEKIQQLPAAFLGTLIAASEEKSFPGGGGELTPQWMPFSRGCSGLEDPRPPCMLLE